MNLNFRKTALLAGICSVFSLGYAPQLFAVSSTDTVEAVQQTKKIKGRKRKGVEGEMGLAKARRCAGPFGRRGIARLLM